LTQREFVIELIGRGIRLVQAMPLDRLRRFAQRFTAFLDQPIPQARERLVMPFPALWDSGGNSTLARRFVFSSFAARSAWGAAECDRDVFMGAPFS
jgi:hypothetical protein